MRGRSVVTRPLNIHYADFSALLLYERSVHEIQTWNMYEISIDNMLNLKNKYIEMAKLKQHLL